MRPANATWIFSAADMSGTLLELEESGLSGGNESNFLHNEPDYPVTYRVVATVLHALILILGVAGNIVLIMVARRTRSLQTPTYCYLVSLAYADLLVLLSAVPEAIVFHHVGRRWLLGQAICSLFIFINFLGINAGSISILAFTVERYIAIVRSPLAVTYCTTERTRKIIIVIWIVTVGYCCPWLALTEVKPDSEHPDRELCDFRFSPQVYMGLFVMDFGLFYVIPLVVAVFVYCRIAVVLCRSAKVFNPSPCGSIYAQSPRPPLNRPLPGPCRPSWHTNGSLLTPRDDWEQQTMFKRSAARVTRTVLKARTACINQSRVQVLPMLVVTVFLFAFAWLPFRGLLIYNSLVDEPWLDIWYLLLAKTLIYLNSAINPLIYNAMSRRFRVAVRRTLSCRCTKRKTQLALTPMFLSVPPSSSASDKQRRRPSHPFLPAYSGCHSATQPTVRKNVWLIPHSRTALF